MNELTCFKAYDIRGRLGKELNESISYRIGRAFGEFLKPQTVVLGGDARLSSEALKLALSKGLRDSGVDVLDIGLSGTEEIYFATSYLEADGGIQVTASHNPMDYNGMKLVREGSRPISNDTGLKEIKHLAEKNNFGPIDEKKIGNYKKVRILDSYVEHLFTYIDTRKIKPIKLVINTGNGAAGHVIDALEKKFELLSLPIELVKVHNHPDGNFPNGIPNPLLPENREDTVKAILNNKADAGIAFDGDFDRCFLFDHEGHFIEGYYIVGLLAEFFLKKEPGAKIIHDPRLTWNTIELVNKNGGKPIQSKTGHAFIKERMRLEDAIYGGEMSAHHYFRDFFYCDSGMIPWLLVVALISQENKSLKELVEECMIAYPSSGEINSSLINVESGIQKVLNYYKPIAKGIDFTDGISMDFEDWRFNLRSSNTEPLVRLNVESRNDKKLMEEKKEEILNILRS